MPFTIEFRPAAARELRKLTKDVQARVAKAIDALAVDPRHSGVIRMKGGGEKYRVRVGDHRVLYEIHDAAVVVKVVKLGDRKDVYER